MAANASDDRHERTDARVTSLVFSNAGVGERDVLQLSRTGGLMFACSSCSPRAAPHLNSGRAVITMWSLSTSWRLHTIGRTLVPCTLLDFGLCLRRPARRPGGAGRTAWRVKTLLEFVPWACRLTKRFGELLRSQPPPLLLAPKLQAFVTMCWAGFTIQRPSALLLGWNTLCKVLR